MSRTLPACALAFLAACGGPQGRPEPPSGAVDPGVHGLATPGEAAHAPARPTDPAAGSLGGLPGALPGVLPGASPGAPPTARDAPKVGEASGAIVMTREHCETLGRKFAELTMMQGGAATTIAPEAQAVGRTFADRCARDMVGQTVDMREYQCMLRAQAPDELLGCKR